MGSNTVEFIKQYAQLSPGVKAPPKFRAFTDREGHYDLDGASYACDQVVIASDGKTIPCYLKKNAKDQDSNEDL